MYGCANSCCVRDAMQASMRIRHIKSKTLHFYLDNGIGKTHLPTTMPGVEKEIAEKVANLTQFAKNKQLQGYVEVSQIKDTTGWMKKIYLHNLLEDNISRVHHAEVFEEYLKMCGYKISTSPDDLELKLRGNVERPDYDSILDVCDDYIFEKVQLGEASEVEKWMVKKYYFQRKFDGETNPNILKGIWSKYWGNQSHEERISHLQLEKRAIEPETVFKIDYDNAPLLEYMSKNSLKFEALKDMLLVLGLSHSVDTTKVITWQEMEEIIPKILQMKGKIQDVFQLRDKSEGKGSELRQGVELISKILTDWSGSKLKRINRKKIKIDGKRKEVHDYQISNGYDDYVNEIGQVSIWDILYTQKKTIFVEDTDDELEIS